MQQYVVRYQATAGFHSVRQRQGIHQGRTTGMMTAAGLQTDAGRCWLCVFIVDQQVTKKGKQTNWVAKWQKKEAW